MRRPARRVMPRPRKRIGREHILAALVSALEPLDYVYAMWEGGAIGHGRLDEWSDIDLYVDARDGRIKEVFPIVERALESVSPIEVKYDVPSVQGQGYAQAFYRLVGTSKFLLIDLAVFKHGCEDKFLESEIHGEVYFCFNKRNAVKPARLDEEKLLDALKSRVERIRKRYDTFGCFIRKEINRKNWIEAVDLYRGLTLDSLVEVLRIKHKPAHYQFKTRYVHYDLPEDVVEKLRTLFFVANEEDLERKYQLAERWLYKELEELSIKKIERCVAHE